MLDHDFSHGRRAGIAIINIVFIYGNTLIELGANVIPFGADFMSLFPRWLNIKRGMWMCYILGVCICPWQILATATGFLKFLNGYSIFLGSFLGMALTDYLVVRKGNVFVRDLYQARGRYWYFHGVSWRAITTWVISISFMVCVMCQQREYTCKPLTDIQTASRIRPDLWCPYRQWRWLDSSVRVQLVLHVYNQQRGIFCPLIRRWQFRSRRKDHAVRESSTKCG